MSLLYEKLNIAILGFGTVGKGVYEIINKHETEKTKKINISRILVRTKSKEGYESDIFTDKIDGIINDKNIDLVVECIGGNDVAFDYVKKCLENGKKVVTSNKMLLATKYNDIVAKYKDYIKYEATVCGGIHAFHAINEIKKVDKINSFKGIVNGTTNYILSKMTDDKCQFNEALMEAQNLGYAESDPTSDVEGYDAFYKTILLHNEIFNDNIEIDKNTLDDYIKYKKIEGISKITSEDIKKAEAENKVIKLIAYGDKDTLYVRPMKIDKSDYISKVNGNINCLIIESNNLGISSYIGAGAGKLPTAHAVVLDICDFII